MPDRPALKTLEDYTAAIPGTSVAETQLVQHSDPATIAWPTENADDVAPLPAEIEHGIWMVRCPSCPSAQRASFTDQRFYCANVECPRPHGQRWLHVSWPQNWVEIERALLVRPADQFRHWRPSETLQDLKAQNGEHEAELVPIQAAQADIVLDRDLGQVQLDTPVVVIPSPAGGGGQTLVGVHPEPVEWTPPQKVED